MKTKQTVETHLGLADYFGASHLYDGHFDAKCEGSLEEVVAYLEGLRGEASQGDDLSWEGHNGWWSSGKKASAALDEEIARLRRDQ